MTKILSSISIILFLLGNVLSTKAQPIPTYVPANGLVGWWPFNGNATDESGNGINGTIHNATLTSDRYGNNNSAYNFSNGYISCATTNNIPKNGAMTISVWFNSFSDFVIGEFICLGSSSNTTWGAVGGNNAFTVNYGRGCGSTGSSLQQISISYSEWHHVVFVSDGLGGNSDIYFDGIFFGTSTNANSAGCSSSNLYFGADIYSFLDTYNGDLDDIGIWDRKLTPCEVSGLFLGAISGAFTTQPVNKTVSVGNNVQFIASSNDLSASFQWQTDIGTGFQNLNNVTQYNGVTNDTLTISNTTLSNNNQPFRCIITSGICKDTSDVATLTVSNDVGIHEYSKENLFSIYPNPSSNQINLKATSGIIGSTYSIYDYTGKVIMEGKIRQENTLIDLKHLAIGMYVFSAGTYKKQTIKIIKE
jgi:hypothetical protein